MDFDSRIFEALEAVLAEHTRFHNQLDDKKSILEIVQFIEKSDGNFSKQYKQILKLLKEAKKSSAKSEQLRKAGNVQYTRRNYAGALELFNRSVCFAPKESHQLSKGYANRSAVYFSLKMYDTCLKNIELARKAGYPQDLMEKLNERQAKCEELLKSIEAKTENQFNGLKPELSYPPHEKVPFIANCLDLKKNRRFSRHIVTNADLKVGDVVAIERPFCGVPASDIRYNCCTNCLGDNDLSLIPCSGCHSTMFCSQKCQDEAKAEFHQIECSLIDVLHEIKVYGRDNAICFDAHERIVIRILVSLVNNFQSVGELMDFVKKVDSCEHNAFTVDHQSNKRSEFLAAILKLERNEEKMSPEIKNAIGTMTGLMYNILVKHTDYRTIFKTGPEINFLTELVFRLQLAVLLNAFPISGARNTLLKIKEMKEKAEIVSGVCYGVYLFSSLLNHSCAPNAHQAKHGTNNVIVVVKPIKAGEQLFVSYGFHHFGSNRKDRLEQLELYSIHCDCLACTRNYPAWNKQSLGKNRDFLKPSLHSFLVGEYEVDAIKRLIPKYQDFLNANSREHFPDKSTSTAEMLLANFLNVAYTDKLTISEKQKLGLFNFI